MESYRWKARERNGQTDETRRQETLLGGKKEMVCEVVPRGADKITRPIRPTMRPHDDEMIVR